MPSPRHILITGVSRGLGRALVEPFLAAGHRVTGCARNHEAMAELSRQYPQGQWQALDVADANHVQQWAKELLATQHAPDLLINNAALINRNAPLWEQTPEEFSQIIDVNIKGVFHIIQAFLPAMVAAQRGIIVNLSSGWGRSTSPEVAPYCATKWAIEGLSRALAQELPAGMACIPLNPGIIDTDMLRSTFGGGAASYPDATEWARRAAPFLLGLTAQDNGQALTVPGG